MTLQRDPELRFAATLLNEAENVLATGEASLNDLNPYVVFRAKYSPAPDAAVKAAKKLRLEDSCEFEVDRIESVLDADWFCWKVFTVI